MTTSFQRPVGPKADLAELEYVASLHQSQLPDLRSDCSISCADVRLFLRSRYGICIDKERSLDLVYGLKGACVFNDDDEQMIGRTNLDSSSKQGHSRSDSIESSFVSLDEDQIYLDVVEWMSALLIPTFVKASQSSIDDDEIGIAEVDIRQELSDLANVTENTNPILMMKHFARKFMLKRDLAQCEKRNSLKVSPKIFDFIKIALIDALPPERRNLNGEDILLTPDIVNELLNVFGESADENVVQMMVESATNPMHRQNGIISVLDGNALALAVTSDILLWQCGVEDNLSTPFFDVFKREPTEGNVEESNRADANINLNSRMGEDSLSCSGDSRSDEENVREILVAEQKDEAIAHVHATAPCIDSATDTYQSIAFHMALWVYFIFSAAVFMTFITGSYYNIFQCSESFWCTLANRIWTWLALGVFLCFSGLIILIPISLANDPFKIGYRNDVIAVFAIMVFTFLPYAGIMRYKDTVPHGDDNKYTDLDIAVNSQFFKIILHIYLAYGSLLLLFIASKLIASYFASYQVGPGLEECIGKRLFSSNLNRSAGTKLAATRKLNLLLKHAEGVHHASTGAKGDKSVLKQFLIHQDAEEDIGGIIWTWKHVLSGDLLKEHGVWVHSRLAVAQEGQIISFLVAITALFYQTNINANNADAVIREINSSDPGHLKDLALWYMPTGSMIRNSSYVGISFAIAVGILLICVYLPSAVSTVLKLRCGIILSMGDNHYQKYRLSADSIYYNVGNMIYGLIGSQLLFFLFFGMLVFLFLWPVTSAFMIHILAWFTALMITILSKYLMTRLFRKKYYSAFYRRRPRAANLSALAMECWHLGLGGGVLAGRLVQFLLASIFWIGRIDVPYLCDDVHILGYRFDTAPSNFRKELLVHEAHRHPYIDRLATMYLMRLRHGKMFCSNAGCAWRRLFILSLMPWLSKYRQKNREAPVGSRSSERRSMNLSD